MIPWKPTPTLTDKLRRMAGSENLVTAGWEDLGELFLRCVHQVENSRTTSEGKNATPLKHSKLFHHIHPWVPLLSPIHRKQPNGTSTGVPLRSGRIGELGSCPLPTFPHLATFLQPSKLLKSPLSWSTSHRPDSHVYTTFTMSGRTPISLSQHPFNTGTTLHYMFCKT